MALKSCPGYEIGLDECISRRS